MTGSSRDDAVNVVKQQGQDDIVVVVDQSIYAKAQKVLWKAAVEEPDKFGNVVVRMGGFHVMGVMLAIIGKRFGDAGLCDLLVELELVAQGSVDGVIRVASTLIEKCEPTKLWRKLWRPCAFRNSKYGWSLRREVQTRQTSNR